MTIRRLNQRVMKRIRAKLRAANPHCHWCGVLTLEGIHDRPDYGLDKATVDHLKPRRECKSAEEYHAEANLVLACYECNLERDRIDIALMKHQREQLARVKKLRAPVRRVLVRVSSRR
jgi:5-methylcytosine-specific restriction endonuclease McrA